MVQGKQRNYAFQVHSVAGKWACSYFMQQLPGGGFHFFMCKLKMRIKNRWMETQLLLLLLMSTDLSSPTSACISPVIWSMVKMDPAPSPDRVYLTALSPWSISVWSCRRKKIHTDRHRTLNNTAPECVSVHWMSGSNCNSSQLQ